MGRRAKLDADQVERIRYLYHMTPMSMGKIARNMGVSSTLVNRVIEYKPPYERWKGETDWETEKQLKAATPKR